MKHSHTLRSVLLFLFAALPCAAFAQGGFSLSSDNLERVADLDFENLNTRDTLPHQSIYAFTQDTTGYLWIATYGGLSRYDGAHFRTYTNHPNNPSSLPSINIRNLLPGSGGDLWVGTDNAGISLYRARTDSFEPLPHVPSALRNARIYSMISDGHGGIWAGGQFGLFHYDGDTHAYQIFSSTADRTASTPLRLKRVFSLFLDRSGALWVGGDSGLEVRRPGSAQFDEVPGIEGRGEVGLHPFVWAFAEDHAGKLWIGCDHVGLATYDPVAHLLRGVPGLAGAGSTIGEHTVRGILEHAPGQFWIATYGGGLITYQSRDGYIRSFTKTSGTSQPLKSNFLRGIFRDRSGVVWLATDNGVAAVNDSTAGIYQIHPKLEHPEKTSGTEVRSVAEVNGKVWVGLDQGEFGTLEEEARIKLVSPASGEPERQISGREILAIQGDKAGAVYAAGTGLFRIDVKTNTYREIRDPLIANEIVGSLALDGDEVWAGTYNGLYHYNAKTRQSRMERHDEADPNSLSENDVHTLLRLSDGRIWLATRAGLSVRDPRTGHFRAFPHVPSKLDSVPSNNLWALAEDHSGRLWVATTDAGLAVLTGWTPAGQPTFHTIDMQSGLPSNSVISMTVGSDGRIWVNTTAGLAVIHPDTFAVQIFSAGEGLHSTSQKFFGSTSLGEGSLLFRGPDGLIAIVPSRLEPGTYRAPLVLTSIRLQHEEQSPILTAYGAANKTIRLNPNYHGFEATFALLDYTAPEDTRYFYKLDGIDEDWIEAAQGNQTVSYSDLPPGDYLLHLRAENRYQQGPLVESSFSVKAPRAWYETVLFRILMLLFGLGMIYLLIRIRTSVLERRRTELEREIVLRTEELNEQRDRLEEANRLLRQLSIRDPLTDLYNRRYFMELLEKESLRSWRSREPFSLLLIDVDHFKSINDTFGHLVGDSAIQAVATRIGRCLRITDTLARFGGEEYIVLLPNTRGAAASILAERILSFVSATPIEANGSFFHATISIGCTESDPDTTTASLVERVDKALYQAKSDGRNCYRLLNI